MTMDTRSLAEDIIQRNRSGGTSTGTTATKAAPVSEDRWLESYSATELRYLYRAGYITEDEWQAELVDRNNSVQAAKAEVERQKSTGLSTAASTKGQLTASEKAAVDAMKAAGAPEGKPAPLSGVGGLMASRDAASKPWAFEGGKPSGILDGTSGGGSAATSGGASSAVGPGGRTLAQVKGTEYLSDAERAWYLSETAKGGSTAVKTGPEIPRATGSSGGSSASGGGGTKVAAAKAAQGAVTEDEIIAAGGKQIAPGVYQVNGVQYRKQTDGTYDVSSVASAPPPKKLSPLEQSAQSLNSARGMLGGGEQAATPGQGSSSPATAPAASEPRLMTANDTMVPGGVRLTGLDQPGYGQLSTVGTAGNNVTAMLDALHVKPTGDPQMDLRTVLGGLGERELLAKQGMSPLEIQSMIDQRAYDRARPYGGAQPHYDAAKASVSTPSVNAQGKIVIDDTPGHYRELLEPQSEDPYSYMAKGGNFDTSEPIIGIGAFSMKPKFSAGWTGKEKVSIDPVGPHGTPEEEMMIGSRAWPGLLGGARPAANGIEDVLQDFMPSDAPYTTAGPSTVDFSSQNGGRDPDYISASMLGLEPGGISAPDGAGQRQVASWNREFKPTLSPEEIYLQRKAQGWAGNSTFLNEEPETNDDWLRYVQTHLNDPMTRLPNRLLPKQFLQDPAITRARKIALNPEYYGYTDQYMANGGSGTAGEDSFDTPPEWYANQGYRQPIPQADYQYREMLPMAPSPYQYREPLPQAGPFVPDARLDTSLFTDRRGMPMPYSPQNPPHNPMTPGFYADGGSGYTGHPGNADGGMFSNLEKVFRFGDLENAGVYSAANRMWEGFTPNMQNNLWGTMAFPGMGHPVSGNYALKAVSYPGLYNGMYANRTGGLPMASLYNTDLAPTSLDIGRELGNQYNANASYSLGLQAPMTQRQIMNTPISKLRGDGGTGGGLVQTMADGGVLDVNPYDIQLGREAPYYNAQTPVPLVDPVRVLQGLRKKVAA